MLAVKVFAFLGVLLNFLGSVMLLRDFRDIVQLPFFRWRTQNLQRQIHDYVKKSGGFPDSVARPPMMSKLPVRNFRLYEIIRAGSPLGELMRLSNEHNGFRKSLGLDPFSVTYFFQFDAQALKHSFAEMRSHLDSWASEPDAESSTDRTKALKYFIGGFFLLTLAAFFDLALYLNSA